MSPNNPQDWNELKARYLDPLTVRPSELFIANAMRRVRAWEEPEPLISRLLRPLFSRWALPAMSLSVASLTVAVFFSLQPVNKAADELVLGGHAQSVTAEWKTTLGEDQVMGLLVDKP